MFKFFDVLKSTLRIYKRILLIIYEKGGYQLLVTVFTPTYNRKEKLKRLYDSLKAQTYFNFEWVIVDDGSTDDTDEMINLFIKENNLFSIKYLKTENGGKHRAINKGLDIAEGQYFFIVDSDDCLLNNSIEIINEKTKKLPSDISGIVCLKKYFQGNSVGTTHNQKYIDCLYTERKKYNITGDKAEVIKTSIMKQYRFPEIKGEKFLSEGVVWNRTAYDNLKMRYFNENIYDCEYLENGLTSNIDKILAENSQGYLLYINEMKINNLKKTTILRNEIAYTFRLKKNGVPLKKIRIDLKNKSYFTLLIYMIIGYFRKFIERR